MALSTVYNRQPPAKPKPSIHDGVYRDIYKYMQGGAYSPEQLIDPEYYSGDNARHSFAAPDAYEKWRAPGTLNNILSVEDYTLDGDAGGGGKRFKVDYSKLPNQGQTKFGLVSETRPIMGKSDLDKLKNRNAVYYDPNYGLITSANNWKDDKWDKIGATVAQIGIGAFMGAGAGALGGAMFGGMGMSPTIGSAVGRFGLSAAQSGGKINAGQLGTLAGGAVGLPSWATGLARTGYDMSRNGGRGG